MNPADGENYISMVELTFVFSMIWSVCASVDEEGRKKMDSYLREMEGSFPNKVGICSPGCAQCPAAWLPPSGPGALPLVGRASEGFRSLTRLPSLGHSVRVLRGPQDAHLDVI